MTPMPIDDMKFLKRNSTTANLDTPVAKKLNYGPLRHHKPLWLNTQAERDRAAPLDAESFDCLLERSIALALEAVGFADAEPRALESFREATEEFMLHFSNSVRGSMLASRRTRPTPDDFLQALHIHQLPLASLLPHLNPPVDPSKSQIAITAETLEEPWQQKQGSLDIFQDIDLGRGRRSYIPRHFPAFPSEHTYKATPELPVAKTDPRTVRELATEEARLGEAALRKLVGAMSDMNNSVMTRPGTGTKTVRAKRDDVWKEAMQAATAPKRNAREGSADDMEGLEVHGSTLLAATPATQNGYLSTSVNAEKKYWRRPVVNPKFKSSKNSTTP